MPDSIRQQAEAAQAEILELEQADLPLPAPAEIALPEAPPAAADAIRSRMA